VQDKTINAFAFFGGHVAVHSGLIMLTNSEDELAGVMAHELAHVAQQHLIRQVAETKRALPLRWQESIAAALIAGPEMMIPVLAGHMQHMVNFTRQHEQEADRIGMQILANAKYDPHGLPDIFERMSTNFRYEGKMPEYLSTHPLYESRIVDTRHRADTLPYVRKTDSLTYHLIKARVTVQSADNLTQLIADLQHQIKTTRYPNELAVKYAHAYALHRHGKNKEALTAIYELVKKYPNNLIVQMTTAEIEAGNNKFKEAQMRLEDLLAFTI
jgi:predicted Zn-dependent protease